MLVLSVHSAWAIDIPLFGKTRKVVINGQVVRVRRANVILKVSPDVRITAFNTPWGRRQFDKLSEFINLPFLRADRVFAPPSYLRVLTPALNEGPDFTSFSTPALSMKGPQLAAR